MKEVFSLVIQMGDQRVQPYVDQIRFIQSQVFTDALRFAIDHYKAHGDRGHMVKLWQLYSGSVARRRLNERFFAEAGVRCSMVQGKVHFDAAPRSKASVVSPANGPQIPEVSQRAKTAPSQAEMATGARASLRAPRGSRLAPTVTVAKKKKKKAKKVDLLDSWARMPGSYGSGKRR
jgi:hypothetical protein